MSSGERNARLDWADRFLPTTNIDRLRDELRDHGFHGFADSIVAFLGSAGAAYSELAYHDAMKEVAALEARVSVAEAVVEAARAYRDDFVRRGRNDEGLATVRNALFAALDRSQTRDSDARP